MFQIGTFSSKSHCPLGLLLSHGALEGDATGLCPSSPFCPLIPLSLALLSLFMSWLIGSDTAYKSACLTILFNCAHFSFRCSVCILASPKWGGFETEPVQPTAAFTVYFRHFRSLAVCAIVQNFPHRFSPSNRLFQYFPAPPSSLK